MDSADFPPSFRGIIPTLIGIYRHKGELKIVEVLESANFSYEEINFDNWNGGTTTWALRLKIPIPLFASIGDELNSIEEAIGGNFNIFNRTSPNNILGEVTISPIGIGESISKIPKEPKQEETEHLWKSNMLPLFLSHLATDKLAVTKLKGELSRFGVSAFVAHEDIEPSLEWRDQIELGLKSMSALAALITPQFHQSSWTDQEIGWALGREVPVIPVRLGCDPYGFAGKFQGISGSFDNSESLAMRIVEVLLKNSKTHVRMRQSLVHAFVNAGSFMTAMTLCSLIIKITDFTDQEKNEIRRACTDNAQVENAFGVTAAIYRVFGKPVRALSDDEIPF